MDVRNITPSMKQQLMKMAGITDMKVIKICIMQSLSTPNVCRKQNKILCLQRMSNFPNHGGLYSQITSIQEILLLCKQESLPKLGKCILTEKTFSIANIPAFLVV